MLRVVPWEERLALQHLRKDTPNGPNVNGRGVIHPGAQYLWCAVPTGTNVLGHRTRLKLLREAHARQAEVTNLQVTVAVHQQIPGFQITVDHLCRVDVLHATQDLVEKKLTVVVRQTLLGFQDRCQIRFHQLRDHVDVLEVMLRAGEEDVPHIDEVLVPQVAQDPELPQSALREGDVLEGILDLLHGNALLGFLILSCTNDAIGPLTHLL
mmetsp:Transcript_21232/g.35395  ORF Transcript_21232/g.35395 Transcript_21232/m.35395 type:complete len:210 (-) Transcript_21232:175-804(-)